MQFCSMDVQTAIQCVIKKAVFLAAKGQSQTSILPEVVRKRAAVLRKEQKQLERKKMKNTQARKFINNQTKYSKKKYFIEIRSF